MEKEGVPKIYLIQEYLTLMKLQNQILMENNENSRIPKIHLFHICEKRNFFTMELLGENTSSYINSFPSTNKLPILNEMLNAIEEVHNKGIVHLDIKPTNFLLNNDPIHPKIYLVDYGLSRSYNGFKEESSTHLIGTINYASYNSHLLKPLSRRDDLWSFFFILIEFINIKLPWIINEVELQSKTKKEILVNLYINYRKK
jgi:serine/threonine protein kinase